jgi:DNA-binding transcriptional regulator YiaG
MTPIEFREALKALGLTQRSLASTLGVAVTTVNRWARGLAPVPQYAVAYLELLRRA